MGQKIGSNFATIIDDGRLTGALGTSPFDGEGVPTRRTVVFDRGILSSFMLDTYYARRLGMQTTANSTGGEYRGDTGEACGHAQRVHKWQCRDFVIDCEQP